MQVGAGDGLPVSGLSGHSGGTARRQPAANEQEHLLLVQVNLDFFRFLRQSPLLQRIRLPNRCAIRANRDRVSVSHLTAVYTPPAEVERSRHSAKTFRGWKRLEKHLQQVAERSCSRSPSGPASGRREAAGRGIADADPAAEPAAPAAGVDHQV